MTSETEKRWLLPAQLFRAIQNSDLVKVSKLFRAGLDADTRFKISNNTKPALFFSVENNDFSMVKLLLELGAGVNQRDSTGKTALHIASEFGYLEIVKLFLGNRGDVQAVDHNGQTPLHLASKSGSSEIVNLLISNWSDVNKVDKTGRTPLHLAATANSTVARSLILAGADAKIKDVYGNTALHLNVSSLGGEIEAATEILHVFPETGLFVNKQGKTPLHILASAGRKDGIILLKAILYYISKIIHTPVVMLNSSTLNGHTALHLAVLEKEIEIAKLLIAAGADINTRDQLNKTPLDCAIRDGDSEIVTLLIAAGASTHDYCISSFNYRVCNPIVQSILYEASRYPMSLLGQCRRTVVKTYGPRLQFVLTHLPKSWQSYLSYEEL